MATGRSAGRYAARRHLQDLREHFWQSDRSLTALLVFLVFTVFLADPLADLGHFGHFVLGVVFSLLLISGVLTVARTRVSALLLGSAAVVAMALHWTRFFSEVPYIEHADVVGTCIATSLLAGIVLVQVFREGPITIRRIQGAIAVYLLLGLIWATLYGLVYLTDQQAFIFPSHMQGSPLSVLRSRLVYFSFTTLTTVGYGDITPVSPLARSLAMLEAVIGQLFPAILLARLVSMEMYYRQRRFEREQAELDREALTREIERGREPGRDQ